MAAKNPWSALLKAPDARFVDAPTDDANPAAELDPSDIAPVRPNDPIAPMLRAFSQRVPQDISPGAPAGPKGARGSPPPELTDPTRAPSSNAQTDLLAQLNQLFPAAGQGQPPVAPPPQTPAQTPPGPNAQTALLGQLNRGVSQGVAKRLLPPPQPPAPGQDPQGASNRPTVAAQQPPGPMDGQGANVSSPGQPGMYPGLEAARLSGELPLMAPRSGQKATASETASSGTTNKIDRNSYLDSNEAGQLSDTIMNLPFMKHQIEDNANRSQLAHLTAGFRQPQLDLSPLAALADSWVQNSKGGGQKSDLLAASESAAKLDQAHLAMLAKMGSTTAADDQNVTKDALEAFTKLKSGKDMMDAYSKLGQTAGATNTDPAMHLNPLQGITTFDHLVERGMNTQQDQEAGQQIRTLQGILQNGKNAIGNQQVPIIMAKIAAGNGRIAAYEMTRGNPAAWAQFQQLEQTLADGNITPENLGLYKQYVGMLAHAHNQHRQMQANRYTGMADGLMVPSEYSSAALPGSFVSDVPEQWAGMKIPGQSGGSAPRGGMTPSETAAIQAEAQRRAALKKGK